MKPSWEDAPEWAQYLAMDEDGSWFFYEEKPKLTEQCWKPVFSDTYRYTPKFDGWENTLEERPA